MFTYIWRTSVEGQRISAALQNVITTLFCNTFYPYKMMAVILRLMCSPNQHHSHEPVFYGGSTPESPEQVLMTHLEMLTQICEAPRWKVEFHIEVVRPPFQAARALWHHCWRMKHWSCHGEEGGHQKYTRDGLGISFRGNLWPFLTKTGTEIKQDLNWGTNQRFLLGHPVCTSTTSEEPWR